MNNREWRKGEKGKLHQRSHLSSGAGIPSYIHIEKEAEIRTEYSMSRIENHTVNITTLLYTVTVRTQV